jgi:phage-related protein
MDNKNNEYNIEFYNEGKSKKHTAWNFINSLRQKGDDQSKALLNAIFHKIGLLKSLGTNLNEPHSKTLKETKHKLREIRIKHTSGAHRIFYCCWDGNSFVMLNHFIKKSNKTPSKEIALAESLMDDWIKKKGGEN